MLRWGTLACVLGLAGSSCGSSEFVCGHHSMCEIGQGGRCEETGYCSFPDPECESGYRYGNHAPAGLADMCTDPVAGSGDSAADDDAPATTLAPDTSATTAVGDDGDDFDTSGGDTDVTPACADWWDCAWIFRREIAVSGSGLEEPLDGFPVAVILEDISDPARFGASGRDIRFVDESGATLPFEVDTWDVATQGVVWVRIPSVVPDRGARAFVYYGNPSAPASDRATQVWDEEFAAVWHLDDGEDATDNGNHAQDEGSAATSGVLGGARAFEASGQRMVVMPSPSLTDLPVDGITISVWLRPVTPGFDAGGRVIDSGDAQTTTVGYTVLTSPSSLGIEFNRGAMTMEGAWIDDEDLAFGRWIHLAFTFLDGEDPQCWIDAQPIAFENVAAPVGEILSDADAPIGIGGAPYDLTHTLDGSLDELRLSRGRRSAAWLAAEYRAATGQLVTLGAEETAPQ